MLSPLFEEPDCSPALTHRAIGVWTDDQNHTARRETPSGIRMRRKPRLYSAEKHRSKHSTSQLLATITRYNTFPTTAAEVWAPSPTPLSKLSSRTTVFIVFLTRAKARFILRPEVVQPTLQVCIRRTLLGCACVPHKHALWRQTQRPVSSETQQSDVGLRTPSGQQHPSRGALPVRRKRYLWARNRKSSERRCGQETSHQTPSEPDWSRTPCGHSPRL